MNRWEQGKPDLRIITSARYGIAPRRRKTAARIKRYLPRWDVRAIFGWGSWR